MDKFSSSLRPAQKARIYAFLRPLFGRHLLDQLRLHRNFYFYRKAGIIFIHIPKAAGSSISHSLYGRSLGHFSASQLLAFRPSALSTHYSFSVVRHPLSRLRSAYNYIRSKGTAFGSIAPNATYLADDFQTFESFLKSWLPRQNLSSLDPVLRPQSNFLCDYKGLLLIGQVFKLENLHLHWPFIRSHGHLYQKNLERRNVNSYRSFDSHLDEDELERLVGDFYATDIELWDKAI